MQDNCVNIHYCYVDMLELKVHISGAVLLLIQYITVNDLIVLLYYQPRQNNKIKLFLCSIKESDAR